MDMKIGNSTFLNKAPPQKLVLAPGASFRINTVFNTEMNKLQSTYLPITCDYVNLILNFLKIEKLFRKHKSLNVEHD